MSQNKIIVVDSETIEKLIAEIKELKQMIIGGNNNTTKNDQFMDTADVLEYLKISRRTLTKYKSSGLPHYGEGKPYFSKGELDDFIRKKSK